MDQITEIRKKYFPEKSLSQIFKMVQEYYKTDISTWSDEKIAESILHIVEESNKPQNSNVQFVPAKAKAIQIIFTSNEVLTIPVSNIPKLLVDKISSTMMLQNDELEETFVVSDTMHTADSIVIKFENDNEYTAQRGLISGQTAKLTKFLEKPIYGIRCVYPDNRVSYIVQAKWENAKGRNKLQRFANEYEGIVLYLGEYARA